MLECDFSNTSSDFILCFFDDSQHSWPHNTKINMMGFNGSGTAIVICKKLKIYFKSISMMDSIVITKFANAILSCNTVVELRFMLRLHPFITTKDKMF